MTDLKVVAIGDCVHPVETWNPLKAAGDDAFTYVDLSAIDQERKQIVEARSIACADAPSRAKQLVKEGDVLVSTVRPNLNGVARVGIEHHGATASTGFCVLRPTAAKLDGSYAFQWVKSPGFVADMVSKATGASYPAVSDRIILESRIPLPPLPEQRRIAAILDHADALRAKRREALAQLDSLSQSIFIEMFDYEGTNLKALTKRPLGDVIQVKSGDFLPSTAMSLDGKIPVFGGNGVNGFHNVAMFRQPKIVIGRVGAYCGCVNTTPSECWVTDNAMYVSRTDDSLLFDYLAVALRRANLNRVASQSGQPLVSAARIYPVEILVPPIGDQQIFATRIQAIEYLKATHRTALAESDALFASLQHRAFAGQLS